MRRPIIAANWKMNKTSLEATEFMDIFSDKINGYKGNTEVVLIPPFTILTHLIDEIDNSIPEYKVAIGAQNVHWEENGAYTGEISTEMLIDVGCEYVIIGHSERREYFAETDDIINAKIATAIKAGLKPIFCIGEREQERKNNETLQVIKSQLKNGLTDFESTDLSDLVIAYEPVWAIGTGLTATPEQAEEVHKFIRRTIKEMFGEEFAEALRIQYGGSVKPGNIIDLMSESDIDGALVGGASLDPDSFFTIISFDK
jgi:triosephosphate isomerase